MTRLAAVIGSPMASRRTRLAVETCLGAARAADPALATSLHELAGSRFAGGEGEVEPVMRALHEADGVVLATPVYRGSYTGVLKLLLDALPTEALEGKPVALVATGASLHHYLMLDRDLRGVLAWFNAFVLPGAVYLAATDFDESGLRGGAASEGVAQLGRLLGDLAQRLRGAPPPPPTLQARLANPTPPPRHRA